MDIADVKGEPNPPKGWMWQLVPDYPVGDVIAACICGSWPGGPMFEVPADQGGRRTRHRLCHSFRSFDR